MPKESPVFSVSEITHAVKQVVEDSLVPCWVEGEVSNWIIHSSGHCYFSLKDQSCQIRAVLWRSYRSGLNFEVENGIKVIAYGAVKVYERGGSYQLNVFSMRPYGTGKLQAAFEQLKEKLLKEGLFNEERKQAMPEDITRIGVVTSPTGAAIRDIVNVVSRRSPTTQIILNPVRVQGQEAAVEIANAIEEFNTYGKVDLLIVGRGGGSSEDLWAFNEEVVARAIAASKIPVISAVGHEIDYTISDFVADMRAPTPSAAAELAVPDRAEKIEALHVLDGRLQYSFQSYFQNLQQKLKNLIANLTYANPEDTIRQYTQRVDDMEYRLTSLVQRMADRKKSSLAQIVGKLESLSPLATFARGYSITKKADTGRIVKSAKDVDLKEEIITIFKDGKIRSMVVEKTNNTE